MRSILGTEHPHARIRDALPVTNTVLIHARSGSLPRNPNGKIDRKLMAQELRDLFGAGS